MLDFFVVDVQKSWLAFIVRKTFGDSEICHCFGFSKKLSLVIILTVLKD